ncbi:MAG: hypothetical protein V2I33_05820 [Kangiellaceae bacterium]|jgi:pimeloyl-ACP methyl ester carboxylesterase|nr:hypothetical protein [Kangiellaceae bacterium]
MNKGILISLISVWLTCLLSNPLNAEPVSITYNKLKLNGNMMPSADKTKPFFIIVHGTWATHNMELPTTLQELLFESDYGSLAITLSMNLSDRKTNYACNKPLKVGHDDNINEIGLWLDYLAKLGYRNIHAIGHSRGGSQLALFNQRNDSTIKFQYLIAPMTFEYDATLLAKLNSKADDEIITDRKVLYCDKVTTNVGVLKNLFGTKPEKNTPSILSKSKMPTVVFLGSEDPLTKSFKSEENTSKLVNRLSYQEILIDGAGHFFRDLYSDEIVEHIVEFIER